MKQQIEIEVNSFKEVVPTYNETILFRSKIRKNLNKAGGWFTGYAIDYRYDWSCDAWAIQSCTGEIYYTNEVDFWYYLPTVKVPGEETGLGLFSHLKK